MSAGDCGAVPGRDAIRVLAGKGDLNGGKKIGLGVGR